MKVLAVLPLMIAVAACGPRQAPSADPVASSAEDPVAAQSQTSAAESSVSASFVVALSGVPDAFLGKWDASTDACREKSSEMRLTIESTTMRFYESRATLTSITLHNPGDISAQAAMTGEGEKWDRQVHLVLSADGQTLTLDEGAGGVRVRCP